VEGGEEKLISTPHNTFLMKYMEQMRRTEET
jgi:hypothetical protein